MNHPDEYTRLIVRYPTAVLVLARGRAQCQGLQCVHATLQCIRRQPIGVLQALQKYNVAPDYKVPPLHVARVALKVLRKALFVRRHRRPAHHWARGRSRACAYGRSTWIPTGSTTDAVVLQVASGVAP